MTDGIGADTWGTSEVQPLGATFSLKIPRRPDGIFSWWDGNSWNAHRRCRFKQLYTGVSHQLILQPAGFFEAHKQVRRRLAMESKLRSSLILVALSVSVNYIAWLQSNAYRSDIPKQDGFILLFDVSATVLALSVGASVFFSVNSRLGKKTGGATWGVVAAVLAAAVAAVAAFLISIAWPWFAVYSR